MMDAGVSITIDTAEVDRLLVRLGPVLDFDGAELMDIVGAVGESQTRRRITDEKTAPDGTPWKANRAGTPILQQTGRNLLDSVAYRASADEAEWGASWEYAHVHQEGATIEPTTAKALRFTGPGGETFFAQKVTVPARPFVGLSADNLAELGDVVTDFLRSLREEAGR
ncbi:phage virion morphogenesis protein [Aureimonas sp. SK2]|uniref:phage virion morphogenesis protein n=1 Tax=Aureimonas sp. SK2 TaxID=3015992 RepID=UPI002444B27E|nr:phage virion morphogenesis protein [Aureimonas sp. SK2]